MRAFAMTGIVTASWISLILSGSAMRATPPSRRMSAGTRSSAITATAPASSAMLACSAVVTSMITPPFSISARPLFTRIVPISLTSAILLEAGANEILLGRGGLRQPEDDGVPLQVEQRVQALAPLRRGRGAHVALDEDVRVVPGVSERDRERLRVLSGTEGPVRRGLGHEVEVRP